jgi:putative salt-induced outer membrane protein
MHSKIRVAIAVVGSVFALSAHADWTGKGEAGLVIASGNTSTKTANAKLNLADEIGQWKHSFGLDGLYASDSDVSTAQRWEAFEQTDYNYTDKTFVFGAARYEDDRFSGFVYQATLSAGLGRKFINNDATKFTGTAGIGYKIFETRDAFDPATGVLTTPGEKDSEAVFRGTLDYDHRLTSNTKLLDKFLVESGANNTLAQNDLSVQVNMTDVLAIAVGYSVKYNSDPPSGFRSTDRLTTFNLVYQIK